MGKSKSTRKKGPKKHKTAANKDVPVKHDEKDLPPKENESSSSDKNDEPETHASSSEAAQSNTFIVPKTNTLIIGNLSASVNENELRNFFQVAGDIVEIRLPTFEDGTCRGSAQVEFATPEAVRQACNLNGRHLMGQAITLNFGHERPTVSPDSSSLKKPDNFSANTVLIKGFDAAYDVVKIQQMVTSYFESCGSDMRTSIMMDGETGASTGSMFMEFRDHLSVSYALQKNGSKLGGFCLHVEKAP